MQPLRVKLLSQHARAPTRGTTGSAGYDLYACEAGTLEPRAGPLCVDMGIAIEIPPGHYGRIAGRSSLATRGVMVLAGVIDSDYRGPITVVLANVHASLPYSFRAGDRIAQLIIERISTPEVAVVSELSPTERGAGGFGSTCQ